MAIAEKNHAGAFLFWEGHRDHSRNEITLASGNDLEAGAVLGKKVTASSTSSADSGNTGDGTIGSVSANSNAKGGRYTIAVVETPAADAGDFRVEDPHGELIGHAEVGVAFSDEIDFTISDGATDFATGDTFYVDVDIDSEKYHELNPSATDGLEIAAAILYETVDASGGDKTTTAVDYQAVVKDNEIVWPTGITSDEKNNAKRQLEQLGIRFR